MPIGFDEPDSPLPEVAFDEQTGKGVEVVAEACELVVGHPRILQKAAQLVETDHDARSSLGSAPDSIAVRKSLLSGSRSERLLAVPDTAYTTIRTSTRTAVVEARVLSETTITRKVLVPTLVDNPHNAEAGLKVAIAHQRKSPLGEWENMESVPLSTMRAGETLKMSFDCAETLALHQELEQLYALHQGAGVPSGRQNLIVASEDRVVITDPQRAQAIRTLVEQGHSEEIWDQLVAQDPDLATRLSYARLQADRAAALEEFRTSLEEDKPESYWQEFFQKHTWVFGYGLNYQVHRVIEEQPSYGGTRMDGTGGQEGDYLCRTEALARFTVLVEIKKPGSPLFGREEHRNGAWSLHPELTGGVAQVQANCRTWNNSGAQESENVERLLQEQTYTVEPNGILVIGHSSQYAGTPSKRNTFEGFRQNMHKPQILTFDELYERAQFIVGQPAPGPGA